jgi:hypothetical protein
MQGLLPPLNHMKENELHRKINNKTQEKSVFFPKSPSIILFSKKDFRFIEASPIYAI